MEKDAMIGIILAHYYRLVAEYRELYATINWNDDWDVECYQTAEQDCLNMENLLIKLEIPFMSIYGQVYKNGKIVNTEG